MINNTFDGQYKLLIQNVLENGNIRVVRSGGNTTSIHGQMIKHDLSSGFPLTTLRLIPFRLIASELEWSLKGKTDKRWLQERNNHIWNKWANPEKAAYGTDAASIDRMRNENDLGPLYGFQWRHFGAEYIDCDTDYSGKGFDQIKFILDRQYKKPFSKNLLVSSWNPSQIGQMSIPPCPFSFQIIRHGDKLNLSFFQRSVDAMIGLPFDFALYALLLHLFCLQTKLKEGSVVGFFNNVEIFEQHINSAKEIVDRQSNILPIIKTEKFERLDDWTYTDTSLENYNACPAMKLEVNT